MTRSFTKLTLALVALVALQASLSSARSLRDLLENSAPSGELAQYFNQNSPSPEQEEPRVQKAEGPITTAILEGAASWLKEASKFHGDGTAYSDTVDNGKGFACSMRELATPFKTNFAAINSEQWEDGKACGRCIKAKCVDDRCKVKNEEVLVQVVDLCPECKEGDVDFSFGAYKSVTGMWPHRLSIEWEWASCAPEIEGNLKYYPKDGMNPFWQGFYIANARYPIKSVKIDGKELDRSPFQFFTRHGSMPEGGCELEITADSGAVVKATLKSFWEQQDLQVQFPVSV